MTQEDVVKEKIEERTQILRKELRSVGQHYTSGIGLEAGPNSGIAEAINDIQHFHTSIYTGAMMFLLRWTNPQGYKEIRHITVSDASLIYGHFQINGQHQACRLLQLGGMPLLSFKDVSSGSFATHPKTQFLLSGNIDLRLQGDRIPLLVSDTHKYLKQLRRLASQSREHAPGGFGISSVSYVESSDRLTGLRNTWEDWFKDAVRYRTLQLRLSKAEWISDMDTDITELLEWVVPRLLHGLKITPTIVHGDMWAAHAASYKDQSEGHVILDPAAMWAHHEFESANLTHPRETLDYSWAKVEEYHAKAPLLFSEPKERAIDRHELYRVHSGLVAMELDKNDTLLQGRVCGRIKSLVEKFGAKNA